MRISILAVGKLKARYAAAGLDDYLTRLRRYVQVEYRAVRDEPLDRWDPQERQRAVEREGARLLELIDPQSYVIALSVGGEMWSSEALAAFLAQAERLGIRDIMFVIGGAAGLAPAVLSRANRVLSLSPMTFTHQLVPLMLAEQLYRAYKINRGEPYHY